MCKVVLCIQEYSNFVFVMELLRSGKLVPSVPYFYLSIALFLFFLFRTYPFVP